MKTYSNLAIDKDVQEALNRIPDEFTHYEHEELGGRIEEMGYALRKQTARTRFTSKQRNFMAEVFQKGQISGKKFDARETSNAMLTMKKPNSNEPLFLPGELLTWQQISSWWSTYSRKNKRNELVDNSLNLQLFVFCFCGGRKPPRY